jgi:hypothetical protein
LCADGNKTVDVLADWYQDLSSHMSALLRSWSLILDVDTSSSFLHEQLGQFHDRCQTSMSGISICNDGSEVIDICELGAVGFRGGCDSFFALLAVVEKLGLEEMLDLIRDGGLVAEIS